MTMTRRRLMLLTVTLVMVNSFFWLAQGGFALPRAIIANLFGPRMIRAEVLDLAPDGSVQDVRVDRGLIRAVTAGGITISELDGTLVSIPLSSSTSVSGRVFSTNQLRRGMRVTVVRPANGPATEVQVGF
jgi:hypothetical protein